MLYFVIEQLHCKVSSITLFVLLCSWLSLPDAEIQALGS